MTKSKRELAAEVMAAYRRYLDAFNAGDVEALNALVAFPLYNIGDGVVQALDHFPVLPSELKKQSGWHETADMDYEVVGLSATKAHLVLKTGSRIRADGSLIEKVYGFYAWTLTSSGWKLFALSGIVEPAETAFA